MVTKKRSVKGEQTVEIPTLDIRTIRLSLESDSGLIVHKWSEKARKQMLDKQMKKATMAKDAKDPKEEFEACLYRRKNGKYGFPAIAFKLSAVQAANDAGMKMTIARRAFHVIAADDLVEIKSKKKPWMRTDMVRLNSGPKPTSDIRFRPQFDDWSVDLLIRYNARVLSAAQVVNLFNTAGFGVGVGEWRPTRNGDKGMFHVKVA